MTRPADRDDHLELRRLHKKFAEMRSSQAIDFFRSGREARKENRLNLALEYQQKAHSLEPDWLLPILELAELHPIVDGDVEALRNLWKQAVNFDIDNPRLLYLKAALARDRGDHRAEKTHLLHLLTLQPNALPARENLADCLLRLGESREAAEQLEILSRSKPDDAFVLARLADIYTELGQNKKAIQRMTASCSLRTDAYLCWQKLGQTLEKQGQRREAAKAYEQYEKTKPQKNKPVMRPMLPSRR